MSLASNPEQSYVYILASPSGTLYIGVTNNIRRRMTEHKDEINPGFAKRYGCKRLVLIEAFDGIVEAIVREKQLKNWSRVKKEWLIKRSNPAWKDLSGSWNLPKLRAF